MILTNVIGRFSEGLDAKWVQSQPTPELEPAGHRPRGLDAFIIRQQDVGMRALERGIPLPPDITQPLVNCYHGTVSAIRDIRAERANGEGPRLTIPNLRALFRIEGTEG